MATTVNSAFEEFMVNTVNLESEKTKIAKKSRDNLYNNIRDLGSKDNFFNLYSGFDISFGSFSRSTKIRPLDDIDIMVGLNAEGSTYSTFYNRIEMNVNNSNSLQKECCNDYNNILNSTKVINKFIAELKNVNDYKKSETHKNGAAATLQLKSYEWNFDIVPCFLTTEEIDGRNYYLIPDGNGNWKKTDPRKDKDYVSRINQKHNGVVLESIRLAKYWNKRPTMPTVTSYVFECLLLQYFDINNEVNKWIDIRFRDILFYIHVNIFNSINDPKGIQGDLNNLIFDERLKISNRAKSDFDKAAQAISFEIKDKDNKKSIDKWAEILGKEFPQFG